MKELRDLIRPFCEKHNLEPNEVVLANQQITPGEAMNEGCLGAASETTARKAWVG